MVHIACTKQAVDFTHTHVIAKIWDMLPDAVTQGAMAGGGTVGAMAGSLIVGTTAMPFATPVAAAVGVGAAGAVFGC